MIGRGLEGLVFSSGGLNGAVLIGRGLVKTGLFVRAPRTCIGGAVFVRGITGGVRVGCLDLLTLFIAGRSVVCLEGVVRGGCSVEGLTLEGTGTD